MAGASGASTTGGARTTGGASAGGAGGSAGVSAGGGAGVAGTAGGSALAGYTLVWSDEFNAADGTAVDATKWGHDVGGDGWGNSELEYYTTDTANAVQQGGNLVITATPDGAAQHTCSGAPCKYTSARLLTKGLYSATYGRVEARIRMPTGKGIWPAFWMLCDNIDTAPWPACGEIDIMETIGTDSATNHGSMHGPGYSGGSPLTGTYSLPGSPKLSDDFHVYAVEWAMDVVRFYVDDHLFETRTPADIPAGDQWAFNHPFFMILNVAVGGSWPGSPDTTTVFPAQMLVDYVRVYQPS